MYAAAALILKQKQIDELNACWNGVCGNIFRYSHTESVNEIIHRVQKKSNIFIFTIYFSQFLGKFYETFSEYP